MPEQYTYTLQAQDYRGKPTKQPTAHCHNCARAEGCEVFKWARGELSEPISYTTTMNPVVVGSPEHNAAWKQLARSAKVVGGLNRVLLKRLGIQTVARKDDIAENLGLGIRTIVLCRNQCNVYIGRAGVEKA